MRHLIVAQHPRRSQRSSWPSVELYTIQLHNWSTGLPQTDPISRQAPPPRSSNSKARGKIRALTVSKTPALSDIILKLFHVSILRSPEWALSSLPTELANSQSAALKLFKKFTGPFSGLVIREVESSGWRPAHQRAAATTVGPSFARPHVGRAIPSGPSYMFTCMYVCMCAFTCEYVYVCMYPYVYVFRYSQSHLGCHFRGLEAQSSNVSFATFQ